MDYKFQINLRGIIELLSNHLYRGPEVFLRELLQNGVDAIRARLHAAIWWRGSMRGTATTASRGVWPISTS